MARTRKIVLHGDEPVVIKLELHGKEKWYEVQLSCAYDGALIIETIASHRRLVVKTNDDASVAWVRTEDRT